jgi:predicted metal-binding protein
MFIQVTPVIDYSVRGLCCKPYPLHKNGCPNFNHKEGCPPNAKLFDKVFDLNKPIYAIYNVFDFKSHVEKMRAANPGWSQAQLTCCLYWQNGARKQLSTEIFRFLHEHARFDVNLYVAVALYKGLEKDLKHWSDRIIPSPPEAMGVNLTATMKNAGIELEWPPVEKAYQIALAGILIEGERVE